MLLKEGFHKKVGGQRREGYPVERRAGSPRVLDDGSSTNVWQFAKDGRVMRSMQKNDRLPTVCAPSSCSSPDGDSAFGDASSTESARCRNSAFSSNDSCRDSLHTPSPTQISPRSAEPSAEELKAAKIKQALEKMREAKVTRIFVKFFVEDGAPLQMLVDERWTVADTMQQLADKHHIFLCEDHCIVEEFPDLYIRRIYEDHENLVENIQMWVQDSPNKLHFIRRPDKYPFIDRPELYLVTEKTADLEVPAGDNWTREVKTQFVQEFFSRETVSPPELEGFLYLKSDGRKSWKKHFFVLRPSGLYYAPKGKKSLKDLQCLMNLHSNQVYTGINWAKKYKAPTDWCIAIKLTQLQMKRSQYIKYICADDESTFRRWLVGLRIAKNGVNLMSNYARACERRREALSQQPVCVPPPRVASSASQQPISVNIREQHGPTPSCSSSRHDLGSNYSDHSGKYDEQPTGTIKRAPLDVLRRVSHSSSSNGGGQSIGTPDDEDSDEEFPAPPPVLSRTSTPSQTEARVVPAAPPKPLRQSMTSPSCSPIKQQLPQCVSPPQTFSPASQPGTPTPKKAPPPPPPKRSEATRIVTAISPQPNHMSDLEAALARRREKIAQN
ncbi:PH domain protein [Teladorsagia circumcincta]|uniref:PH domain protein n=1 Tax=Teladorsagia circumcincta TaxID=45464 RepID=A0A2G9UL70_TELCI|nr:PH domain protein [Teladorsagia circumcincta]